MGRAPCCDKENVKRGPWSPEEDAKLKGFIEKYGTGGNWIALPQKAGLKRCGKSCRLRWLNYLRPNIKHGEFTDDEDKIICSLYANIGSRWSIIAAQLPGRTDNDIKNYWNTKLKKKLLAMLPSFQKRPYFPLQSPPITYGSDLLLTYDPSSPNFNNHTTSNIMNLNSNNTINSSTTLVQDHMINITHHLSSAPPPPPNSNSLISLITNNNIHNNEISPCYLGFQGDHQQSMYSNTTPLMEYQYYPASDVKEAMLMFGSSVGEGHEVSTTGSSSEGGSCLSQMSYGNYSINKDHGLQKQHDQRYQQIKQEDQFSLQGSGDQTQRFIIDHNYTDQRPKGYNSLKNYEISNLHSDVDQEVKKQQLIGTCTNSSSNSTYLFNDNDEYKTTQDHKDICYHY